MARRKYPQRQGAHPLKGTGGQVPSRALAAHFATPEMYRRLARNIVAARQRSSLYQYELAARSGIAKDYMRKLENAHQLPTLPTLVRIANALKTTASALLEGV